MSLAGFSFIEQKDYSEFLRESLHFKRIRRLFSIDEMKFVQNPRAETLPSRQRPTENKVILNNDPYLSSSIAIVHPNNNIMVSLLHCMYMAC